MSDIMNSPWIPFIGHTLVSACALVLAYEHDAAHLAVFILIWSGFASGHHGWKWRIASLHEAIERERALGDALRQHRYALNELVMVRRELLAATERESEDG